MQSANSADAAPRGARVKCRRRLLKLGMRAVVVTGEKISVSCDNG
jgi:hypothetical protein